ncbi:MAG: ABC transporter ATP-binding protein [Nitrososphaeraceae archaeon]
MPEKDNKTILKIINLDKSFRKSSNFRDLFKFRNTENIKVIDSVNLNLKKGQICVIAGESGSGKTTLARLIMRSIDPDNGKIFYENQDITNINKRELLKLRSEIQLIHQDPYSSLNPRMKIFDIVKEPLEIHKKGLSKKEITSEVFDSLEKVNLEPTHEIAQKYPHMLSGGQRQRVNFARALVLKPKIIIADEPVSMLDVSVRLQILNLMKKLKKNDNISFLYITHDLSTARYIGDEIMVMYKGQIIECGDINEVIMNPLHPYTQALINAVPKIDFSKKSAFKEVKIIHDMNTFKPNNNYECCVFYNKCTYARRKCISKIDFIDIDKKHYVKCIKYNSNF